MRLANGIVLDKEKTFGVLKFSALRHEVRVENEDGTTTEEIKRRTYDLKCSQQERTIQVSIPAEIPVKDYPYNAEVELITDNVHIHPAMVRFTFNTFGDDRVCLIADSAMSCGLPDGQYSLGGQAITVKGPRATLTEHPDTIAGSNTCLYDCMKRAVLEMNVPLESAVRAASETPAKSIGVDNDYGSLAAGRYGNVILADKELNIQAVYQKGTRIV